MSIRILAAMAIFSTLSGGAACSDKGADKISILRDVNDAYRKLINLADRCRSQGCEEVKTTDAVVSVVFGIEDPNVLFRLAVTSYVSAYPQNAGQQRIDFVFDTAWNASVRKLVMMRSPEALGALRSLEDVLRVDAGDALTLKEAIEASEGAVRPH